MGLYNLDKIFEPESIAVVGASEKEGSIGSVHVQNLIQGGYQGKIFPVNPHYTSTHGLKAYPSISRIDHAVDLAIIAIPISSVPSVIRECAQVRVGGAIVVSAGGKETGPQGREIEDRIRREAETGGLRIIGPNCLGIICPGRKLNASFAAHMPQSGKVAFISQSGAICTAILDLALKEEIGFSHFVSIGSMLDVDFGDLIDYLGNYPEVNSILLYIESLTNFRKFMSAARAVSRVKPIVVLKSGRSPAGARAAASHTGAMVGEDAVYDAAFKRAGIVRVQTFGELFDCAELMAKQPRPKGPRLGIITNAGGPGVMAADSLAEYGAEPARLEQETIEQLNELLPPFWSHSNPIDVLGDASPERYAKAVDICLKAKELNGLLLILTAQGMTNPAEVAELLTQKLKAKPCPVFASWMGGMEVEKGRDILNHAGIPTYDTPESAVKAFMYMHEYSCNLQMLQEIPPKLAKELHFDRDWARAIIDEELKSGNGILTEIESKSLLTAYGIPVIHTEVATSVEEAKRLATHMGYPIVVKVHSPDIVHKTEAGGVQLDLYSEAAVSVAYRKTIKNARAYNPEAKILGVTLQPMIQRPDYEILLGAKRDENFGPVILFGMGGVLTELLKDWSIGLPPLNRSLARKLMESTRAYSLLKGYRNKPGANLALLEEMIIRLSQLLEDFPEIIELDMNPVIVNEGRPIAADARVILRPAEVSAPLHLVISPYPTQYEYREVVKDGLAVFIRPIKPEDAPALLDLFHTLSPTSVYYRFFSPMKSLSASMLARFTQIDYDREIALVALQEERPEGKMLGVARVIGDPDGKKAEFAVMVGDPWQGKGVGAKLLEKCLQIAKRRGIETVWGIVLRENTQMLALGRKLGFEASRTEEPGELELTIDLRSVQFEWLEKSKEIQSAA
ncbi:MAG: bifunctional acetate--CoA ligase family protein/GNAT family N-acetyltransferase [Deltaproteobacteria bacterium]|nr:bifunctional acetate--CoA ligase family protein/GNAT family N-acetyltransferase [Deltaproteobacteria bacterium]MDH3850917.1 bifunctional acetate--CoA ligase family protein/GNAT family N-acetyltransferase [Deltaproteobacteria bacterium]MDH3896953.1 bifunctional acetate--CoA ligase family protein/GNAT family N-acetyltransferase [Deltaproteobacteria bacterium]MDH3927694.1 bifunctional acetate--CoA ligase family protein/GNAT family N-acetyltransferase [Deltaproteobacteria bacterium]MDH3949875.1 